MSTEGRQKREESLPVEYNPEEIEAKWQDRWVQQDTYAYDAADDVEAVDPDTIYSVDTPPPTVSGSLHMGHLYGHTLQDFAARYHRMADTDCYFPFGYDDNGIASERLTERELGIRHGDFTRREFQEKCRTVCEEYEADFTEEMQRLAMSIDWDRTYKTIEPRVQRISQLSFVDLYEMGREYRKQAPTIWCPDCETAISQVEQEDAHKATRFNDIAFPLLETGEDGTGDSEADDPGEDATLTISTTRPELLPACVSIFVHPEDEGHRHLVGGTAKVPLFGQEVPIIEDERVDMETGSGIVMCCTFGDQTDIEWYQAHDLPLRIAIDESGTMTGKAGAYEGLSTSEAREAIIEDLDAEGYLIESRDHEHAVQVHERCEVEVEYLVTEQWYVEILDRKEAYLEAGREMDWYPEKMLSRYEHWIEGLEWDWCISRQRDSGIPFPVWYCGDCGEEIIADRERLPVDPIEDDPAVDACPACGHDAFRAEEDVFDTWATSSLTPLINAGWDWDSEATPGDADAVGGAAGRGAHVLDRPELYPMDMRPQGHDIISFWLFHTVVKCLEHTGEVPFDSVLINGHVLDENREKMSKSKGNVVVPAEVMAEYPIDAIRYWAASSSVGDDFPFKHNELRMGEKLIRKLWNASRLVDQLTPTDRAGEPDELADIDRWLLANLDDHVESLTGRFENHEYAKARDDLRSFFWHTFCDDYLEIAKQRVRDGEDASAAYTLAVAHETFLELFAPLVPHVTEEIWQSMYAETGADGEETPDSLHLVDWPEPQGYTADLDAGETAMSVISALRRYKTDAGLPLNADLGEVEVYGNAAGFGNAIASAMHVENLTIHEETPEIETSVADVDLDYSIVGPAHGERVGDIEGAIASDDFEVRDGHLHVAGVELAPEAFELEEKRTFSGEGELIEIEDAAIVVR
ncbi:MAG: valine--tRNA ligase [Halobacteriales archaeon]